MFATFVRRSLPNVMNTVKASIFILNYKPIRVSRCFSTCPDDKHAFPISYLMNSLGFSQEVATKLASTRRFNFQLPGKPDLVLKFFEKHGFSKSQVCKIISSHPHILVSSPENTLLPKFQFFSSRGLSNSGLVKFVSSNPDILNRSLVKHIIPTHNFYKDIVGSDEDAFRALRHSRGRCCKDYQSRVLRNIATLREYGVPQSSINRLVTRLVTGYSNTLITGCDQFTEIVEEVKQLGFNPSQMLFVIAVNAKKTMSKATWEKKMNVYRKWGLSDKQILLAFSKLPHCMMYSEEKITATMDFFVNKMGLESSVIAGYPLLLCASLGNRIIPRCLVLNALLSKGLPEKKISLSSFLVVSEKIFMQRYITRYEREASNLLKLYNERPDPKAYKPGWNTSVDHLFDGVKL